MAGDGKRVALEGMDGAGPREAVDVLVNEGQLERFLDLGWCRERPLA